MAGCSGRCSTWAPARATASELAAAAAWAWFLGGPVKKPSAQLYAGFWFGYWGGGSVWDWLDRVDRRGRVTTRELPPPYIEYFLQMCRYIRHVCFCWVRNKSTGKIWDPGGIWTQDFLNTGHREWESVEILLRPLGNAAYMACLPLLCQGSKWPNGKSIWLVFRKS